MSLRDKVRENKTYISARRSLENIRGTFNNDEILDELMSLHISRGTSALSPRKILKSAQFVLLDSSAQEMTIRSRVTTIKMQALRAKLKLDQIIEPLRNYILIQFRNVFKAEGINGVTNQKKAIESILKDFLRCTRELDYILKISDLVIEDIDSAGWALKRIGETLEQVSRDK